MKKLRGEWVKDGIASGKIVLPNCDGVHIWEGYNFIFSNSKNISWVNFIWEVSGRFKNLRMSNIKHIGDGNE